MVVHDTNLKCRFFTFDFNLFFRFMISCDQCGEWYHGKCVGVTEQDANEEECYICQTCEKPGAFKLVCSAIHGCNAVVSVSQCCVLIYILFTLRIAIIAY